MKTVFILRHGKSDWRAVYGTDHDRPLAERGLEAARLMGLFLSRTGQQPDEILSSTAVRARHTAELALAAGSWDCSLRCDPALYGASVATVLDLLRTQEDALPNLLLVGHQPTWSELIGTLTAGSAVRFPTAALARVDCRIDHWRELEEGTGTLRWLVTPKILLQSGLGT